MVFIKRDRSAPSAWWLVPVGVLVLEVGLLLLTVDGYQADRWRFACLIMGPGLMVWGVIAGLRGQHLEK
ncbi:hypothetical protein AB0230_16745 [Microbacterium sp. NPDC089190]|uniref:hypothetical protein n=1 Tax=Microbacterium sp. NPDC089190 TaxID=3155063 RepID=UPI00344B1612